MCIRDRVSGDVPLTSCLLAPKGDACYTHRQNYLFWWSRSVWDVLYCWIIGDRDDVSLSQIIIWFPSISSVSLSSTKNRFARETDGMIIVCFTHWNLLIIKSQIPLDSCLGAKRPVGIMSTGCFSKFVEILCF